MKAALLDQYYTSPACAKACSDMLVDFLRAYRKNNPTAPGGFLFVEPSAGSGAFLDALPGERWWAGDIDPKHPRVVLNDFQEDDIPTDIKGVPFENRVVLGNPPFGYKGSLAVQFLNKSLEMAPVVGFILPVQFRKWSAQSKISGAARLVLDEDLQADSFVFQGKPYEIRCAFQVWVRGEVRLGSGLTNLRRSSPPSISHPDFESWQYNRTPQAEKYFDFDWDFAVLRQGYGDFSQIHWKGSISLDKKKQWIFIKAKNKEALDRLTGIDYRSLSLKNAGTPGFGKADLVEAYVECLKREKKAR